MPGAAIIEAMAQTSIVLFATEKHKENEQNAAFIILGLLRPASTIPLFQEIS